MNRTIPPGQRLNRFAAAFVMAACCVCALSNPAAAQANVVKSGAPAGTIRPPDSFYDRPPGTPAPPGTLLRSEPLKGVTLPRAMRGWRILYATSVDDKTPATAVATIFAPVHRSRRPYPVVTWAHGTTGLLQKCMPSLTSDPTVGIPALARIAKAGWALVATDYSFAEKDGPHPYLIGEGEARAALDAVRAARKTPGLALDSRTVVWGHSQGGHAALWTGILGPAYAPDVKILGIAAIAPAANVPNIFAASADGEKWLGPYVARSYSRFYPDIGFEQALRPEALAAARKIVNLCGFLPPEDSDRIAEATGSFEGPALDSANKALAARLAENSANRPIAAPVLIAQGLADPVVRPETTDAFVAGRCAAGQRLVYWTFAGLDHGGIVRPGAALGAPLVAWTAARFANKQPPDGCARKNF